jgi:hypothetical protein
MTAITWLDNYSHTFHRSVPRVSKKDYKEMLWAVEARFLSLVHVDFSLVHNNNQVLPIMPPNLFDRDTVTAVIERVFESRFATQDDWKCNEWNITTSPPHLRASCLRPEQIQQIRDGSQFRTRFSPVALHPLNIASNEGLAKILKKFYDDSVVSSSGCHQYHVVVSDVNIFQRALRVHSLC